MARTSSKEKTSKVKTQATAPSPTQASPGTPLGSKRTCPKCNTKFYDFCKEELICPKCSAKLKASQLITAPNIPRAEPKKVKTPEKVVTEALSQDESAPEGAADTFESIDDLEDDDKVVEDLNVDDDDDTDKKDY